VPQRDAGRRAWWQLRPPRRMTGRVGPHSMADHKQSTPRAALITGAGRRIGRATALALAQAGYAVVLHAHRSRAEAEKLAGEIVAAGGRASVVLADLAEPEAVRGLIPAATAFAPLTLLVNNASQFDEDEIASLERARFERTLAVNLTAPLFLAQAFAAQALDGADASIVNIVDQRVLKPTPRFFSYTLSKSALYSATVTLAQALAPKLRVNAVAPGPTLPSARQTAEQFTRQAAAVPLKRGPTPEDIAAAVVYLATARSVTGTVIAVDGGQHLAWRTADSDVAE
jgi:NAD(P)-dependent dehydrogenase (short-subunit alcohol dehydrogenase family)